MRLETIPIYKTLWRDTIIENVSLENGIIYLSYSNGEVIELDASDLLDND